MSFNEDILTFFAASLDLFEKDGKIELRNAVVPIKTNAVGY